MNEVRDLNRNSIFDASWTEVRIRQLQLAVSLCDVIRDDLEFGLHLLHQPAVGTLSEHNLLVVAQRNLQRGDTLLKWENNRQSL